MNITKFARNLILGTIVFVGSAHARAVESCGGFYISQTKTKFSVQSRVFSEEAKSVDPIKAVLDRIIGRVEISLPKKYSSAFARVSNEIDGVSRKHAGRGEELISILEGHIDPNSPTAVRVEEKAVKTEADFQLMLKDFQSAEFAQKFENYRLSSWTLRDTPPPGRDYLTLTEYGQHFVFNLKSEKGKSTFVIKPRFRKYFNHASGKSIDFSDIKGSSEVAFELKLASLSGSDVPDFLGVPGEVFKPRIFINDSIADKIKALSPREENFEHNLKVIESSILELKNSNGGEKNKIKHVEAMMNAVRWLLSKDEGFFKPQYITGYNRDSYKQNSSVGEYQLTVDRNVRVYKAKVSSKTEDMVNYLKQSTIFVSKQGEVFAELKTPTPEKLSNSPLYLALIEGVESNYVATYKKGSGKYALARRMEESSYDRNLISTFIEQGTQYWLIKGLSNLDVIPKEKDILIKGDVHVAFPFVVNKERVYRAIFEYRPLNNLNGTKDAVLSKVKILDELGNEIKSKESFNDIIQDAFKMPNDQILAIDFNGTVVPFVSRISHAELSKYHDFLYDYLKDPTRKLESLNKLTDAQDLYWARLKTKSLNFKKWVIERTNRGLFGIAFATVGTAVTMHVMNDPAAQTAVPLKEAVEIVQPKTENKNFEKLIAEWIDNKGVPVSLQAVPAANGSFIYIFYGDAAARFADQKTVTFSNTFGISVDFEVHKMPQGVVYLTLKKANK